MYFRRENNFLMFIKPRKVSQLVMRWKIFRTATVKKLKSINLTNSKNNTILRNCMNSFVTMKMPVKTSLNTKTMKSKLTASVKSNLFKCYKIKCIKLNLHQLIVNSPRRAYGRMPKFTEKLQKMGVATWLICFLTSMGVITFQREKVLISREAKANLV